jgi:hypothetical protein
MFDKIVFLALKSQLTFKNITFFKTLPLIYLVAMIMETSITQEFRMQKWSGSTI